jgi:hypothetical protein
MLPVYNNKNVYSQKQILQVKFDFSHFLSLFYLEIPVNDTVHVTIGYRFEYLLNAMTEKEAQLGGCRVNIRRQFHTLMFTAIFRAQFVLLRRQKCE